MKVTELLSGITDLTKEELVSIDGVGEVLAKNLVEFANSNRFEKMQADFAELEEKDQGLELIVHNIIKQIGVVCITGSHVRARSEIKSELEQMGYKVTNTVSKKTDYLFAGEDAGSKLQKAEKLGIKIIKSIEELTNKPN